MFLKKRLSEKPQKCTSKGDDKQSKLLSMQAQVARWTLELQKVGYPPAPILAAVERVKKMPKPGPKVTHQMGQGDSSRLEADFVSASPPFLLSPIVE